MCLINEVFKYYLDKFVIVFLDDKLIYWKSEEEHEEHLRMVLQVLREYQLYAKLSKCSFYQWRIHYVGHIISEEGIVVDPTKIKDIDEWKTPWNVIEVRSLWVWQSTTNFFWKIFVDCAYNYISTEERCAIWVDSGLRKEFTSLEEFVDKLLHIILVTPMINCWDVLNSLPCSLKILKETFSKRKSGLLFLPQKLWQGRSSHPNLFLGCDDAWSSHSAPNMDYVIVAGCPCIGCDDA